MRMSGSLATIAIPAPAPAQNRTYAARSHQLVSSLGRISSRPELVGLARSPGRQYELACTVDKSSSAKAANGVGSAERTTKLARDLIDRPRPTRVDKQVQDIAVPVLVANRVLGQRNVVNTMVGHRNLVSGVTTPGQFALSPGSNF